MMKIVILSLFLTFSCGVWSFASVQECSTASVKSTLLNNSESVYLQLQLKNDSKIPMKFEEFLLYENMIDIRAKNVSDGTDLPRNVPLLSPGNSIINLEPTESVKRGFNLEVSFSTLMSELKKSDIEIYWSFELRHDENCFQTSYSNKALIKKMVDL